MRYLKKLSLLLGFFLCFIFLKAQNTYVFRKRTDLFIGIGSGSILAGTLYLQDKVKPIGMNALQGLNNSQVNSFDRLACNQWNTNIALSSDVMAVGSILLPAYFYIKGSTRASALVTANTIYQGLLLSQALANSFKLTLRNRPYLYNVNVGLDEKLKPDGRMSFFSAHTTTVSAMCFGFAFAHQTYMPDSRTNTAIWIGAFTLPALEGILRVKAGRHFPSDVITGYLVGLGISYLVHKIHLVRK